MPKKIKLMIFDIDGTLTDGRIVLDEEGRELKFFNVQDGTGIKYAQRMGIKVALITGKMSKANEKRAADLGIEDLIQGALEKLPPYQELKKKYQLKDEEILMMGDDLLDLVIMRKCGYSVAVPSARPELLEVADYVTTADGGKGAAREAIEHVLKAQGKWEKILERYRQDTTGGLL